MRVYSQPAAFYYFYSAQARVRTDEVRPRAPLKADGGGCYEFTRNWLLSTIFIARERACGLTESDREHREREEKYLQSNTRCDTIYSEATIDGRRLALSGGTATLQLQCISDTYGPPCVGIWERRAEQMLTMEGLISVIGLCLTCFGLGYAIGNKDDDQKQK